MLQMIASKNPTGSFSGVDIDEKSIAYAKELTVAVPNISFHLVKDFHAQPASFDLALITDVLHDSTQPLEILQQAARWLKKPHGQLLAIEPQACNTVAEQLKDSQSHYKYGASLHGCLPSAMWQADGQGLGLLGLTESIFRRLALQAGFTKVHRQVSRADPFNAYYLCSFNANL